MKNTKEKKLNSYIFEGKRINLTKSLEYICSEELDTNKTFELDIYTNKKKNKLYYLIENVLIYSRRVNNQHIFNLQKRADQIDNKVFRRKDAYFNLDFLNKEYISNFLKQQREKANFFYNLEDYCNLNYQVLNQTIHFICKRKDNIFYFLCKKQKQQQQTNDIEYKLFCKGEIPELFLQTKNFNIYYFFNIFVGRVIGCELEELQLEENQNKILAYYYGNYEERNYLDV